MRMAIACLLALACGAATAQSWRCTVGGKTAYQDTPCPGGRSVKTNVNSLAPAVTRSEIRDADMNAAASSGRVHVGMSESHVHQALGQPTRVNTDGSADSTSKQMIFEADGGTIYVYTRNGLVTAIQDRPGWRATSQERRPCPTPQEMKHAEMQASSTTVDPSEKERRSRRLEQMRRCRESG